MPRSFATTPEVSNTAAAQALHELVLAAEGAEDGALGDAGRLGDLTWWSAATPCSRSSGMVTSTIAARRSSGLMEGARGVTRSL